MIAWHQVPLLAPVPQSSGGSTGLNTRFSAKLGRSVRGFEFGRGLGGLGLDVCSKTDAAHDRHRVRGKLSFTIDNLPCDEMTRRPPGHMIYTLQRGAGRQERRFSVEYIRLLRIQ